MRRAMRFTAGWGPDGRAVQPGGLVVEPRKPLRVAYTPRAVGPIGNERVTARGLGGAEPCWAIGAAVRLSDAQHRRPNDSNSEPVGVG